MKDDDKWMNENKITSEGKIFTDLRPGSRGRFLPNCKLPFCSKNSDRDYHRTKYIFELVYKWIGSGFKQN